MALEYFNDRAKAGVLLCLWNILMTIQRQGALEYFNDRSKAGVLLLPLNILMTVPRQGLYCDSVIF